MKFNTLITYNSNGVFGSNSMMVFCNNPNIYISAKRIKVKGYDVDLYLSSEAISEFKVSVGNFEK